MVFTRAVPVSQGLGRTVLRRVGSTTRNRSWRQAGRRGYASGHGHGQQSSEIPWMIGSVAVTIPAAGWLWQQGPKGGSGHGHGHDDSHEKHEEPKEEEEATEEEPQEEESKDEEPKEEPKEESQEEESKDESKDEEPKEESKDEGKDESEDNAASEKSEESSTSEDGSSKGPGEQQKGQRAPTEKKGEKDSQGDFSGAKHPYLDDPEKSKKGLGVTETAKIHGTVDPFKGARGVKDTGSDGSRS